MRVLILAVVLSILWAPAVLAQQGEWTGNINVFLGAKALDEDDWAPVEEQTEFGIKVDFRQQGWPVNLAIDFLSGSGDETISGVQFESETSELNIGVRKIWDQFPNVRPFIGGGFSFARSLSN